MAKGNLISISGYVSCSASCRDPLYNNMGPNPCWIKYSLVLQKQSRIDKNPNPNQKTYSIKKFCIKVYHSLHNLRLVDSEPVVRIHRVKSRSLCKGIKELSPIGYVLPMRNVLRKIFPFGRGCRRVISKRVLMLELLFLILPVKGKATSGKLSLRAVLRLP